MSKRRSRFTRLGLPTTAAERDRMLCICLLTVSGAAALAPTVVYGTEVANYTWGPINGGPTYAEALASGEYKVAHAHRAHAHHACDRHGKASHTRDRHLRANHG